MPYLFKNTDLAAQRLQLLADVFAPSTRAFLRDAVSEQPHRVIDLGCGPGYTTHLLADTLHSEHVVGLEFSEHFVNLARPTGTQQVAFYCHDVTAVPFPSAPADLLYCRYLLTHLSHPQDVVKSWVTQLRPQGLLLMEENEWMHTNNATFSTYLNIVAAMLAQQQNELYLGPAMDAWEIDTAQRHLSRVQHLQAPSDKAAAMFYMNIQSWKTQPFIQEHYASHTIHQLEADLYELTQAPDESIEITWGLRQLALRRATIEP